MYNFILANLDTDSLSICKQDGSPFEEQELDNLLKELNSLMPEKISWEDDGYYPKVVIVKAKNYILYDGEEVKIKGSGLKASMKEPALKEFIGKVINCFVFDKQNEIMDIYHEYVKEIHNVQDIYRWSSKKTLTESILNPQRTTEQKIADAIAGKELQEGEKFHVYFTKEDKLKTPEDWTNDHDTEALLGKLYDTMTVFSSIFDMNQIPKYHLKSHKYKVELAKVLGLPEPIKEKKSRKKSDEISP